MVTGSTTQTEKGVRDFDFFVGRWNVVNRRLKTLFAGSDEWYEFPATSECRLVLGGAGNMDEFKAPDKGITAMTLRLFDPEAQEWSIWWATDKGRLDPPVKGRFEDGRGDFWGDDTHDGQPVRVHFLWSEITPTSARWEQEFSADGGETWEANWVMEFTRTGGGPAGP